MMQNTKTGCFYAGDLYLLWFFLDVFGVLMDSKLSILLSLVDLTLFDPPPDMEEPPLGAGESRMVVREAERPLLLKSRDGH